jgi:hypothetical protein
LVQWLLINNRRINNQQWFSLVRDHAQNFGEISVAYQATVAQLAFALGVLGSQDVTQVSVSPLHLPGGGFLEALGGAFVGF